MVLVRGEKTPLSWFKGRSNEVSYVLSISDIKFVYMNYCLVCELTPW